MPTHSCRILFAALIMSAAASLAAFPANAQNTDVLLPLTLNTLPRGDVFARLRNGDVLLRVSDLEQAGLSGMLWERILTFSRLRGIERADGADLISLTSIAPWLTFTLDEVNLTLSVTADPRLFGQVALTASGARPANIIHSRDTSTFFNYALTSRAFEDLGIFAETGTSIRGNLLFNSFSRLPGGDVVRGISSFTLDEREQLRRWVAGDAVAAPADDLAGSALIGGLTVSKNYGLDPYFVRFPALSVRGTAITPANVEVYVNGVLVSQRAVPPGQFELGNLPATAGAGTMQVVIRDVYGREQVIASPYYYSTAVLARGLSEYTYSAGFVRENFGTESFDYGDPAILAFHRRGWTDTITAGGRVEGSRDLWSGGTTFGFRSRFGDFDLGLGASRADGSSGTAAQFGYQYLARSYSFGGRVRKQSRDYANLSMRPDQDRPLLDALLFASIPVGRGSVSVQWTSADMRDATDSGRLTLLTNFSLTRTVNMFLSVAGVEEGSERRGEYFAGLSFYLGGNTSANLAVARQASEDQILVEFQKPLPLGTGYGFRFQGRLAEGRESGASAVQYQTSFGRYEVDFDPFGNDQDPIISAAGGMVYQAGALLLTRPVQESFALVRVPGVSNVRVFASNQLIGRTDARGNLLVPNLLPYYGNPLRISDQDIPLSYEVRAVEKTVAPPNRGGALVVFPVSPIRSIGGSVMIRTSTGEVAPSYGQLSVAGEGQTFVSPLGRSGEFYLENVPAGTYDATVDFESGRCLFRLQVPGGDQPVVDLGRLVCASEVRP